MLENKIKATIAMLIGLKATIIVDLVNGEGKIQSE